MRSDRQRRPARRRAYREPTEGGHPILVWSMLLGSLAAVIGLAVYLQQSAPAKLDANMCPVGGPTGVHALLVDRSDPITPLQAQRVQQVLNAAIQDAAVGERIDLYILAGDGTQALHPQVSLCRPRSEGSQIDSNPRKLRENYERRFKQPLDAALVAMAEPSTAQTSPIMESVKAVCVAAFGELPERASASMTIVSDMIQYSPLLNHYKSRDFNAFVGSPAYREVLADCHRASVNVLYLIRPRDVRVQDRRHQLFWEQFLDHENAVLNRMEAI